MNKYTPKVGDIVHARSRGETKPRMVVGPVAQITNDSCLVITNANDPEIRGEFWLSFDKWHIRFSHGGTPI